MHRLISVTVTLVAASTLFVSVVSAAPVTASQQQGAPDDGNALSAERCARSLTKEQLDALVGHMLRNERTPAATGCYWALSDPNKSRVGEALLLAKGMPREQLAREREQNAQPPRATPPTRQSTAVGAFASFFALHAPWGSNTGSGTRANNYYQNNGCDSDSADNDWEYVFPLNVSSGQEGNLRYYNTDWGVDAALRNAYPNGVLTFGYHDLGTVYACMGDAAWWSGLGNVYNSLHIYK